MKTFSQMGIVTGRFGGWGNRGRWNKDRWNDWRGGNDTVGYSILDLQLCSLFCISFKQHLFKYGVKKWSRWMKKYSFHRHHHQVGGDGLLCRNSSDCTWLDSELEVDISNLFSCFFGVLLPLSGQDWGLNWCYFAGLCLVLIGLSWGQKKPQLRWEIKDLHDEHNILTS